MDAFHRLAGIQTDTQADSAQPENTRTPGPLPTLVREPPPVPQDDEDNNTIRGGSGLASASIPLNRKPSQKSISASSARRARGPGRRSGEASSAHGGPHTLAANSTSGEAGGADDEEADFIWGPTHPCFPHPNPHVAADSEAARTTRVIRVRRDWLAAGDLCPQYANLYPEILDPLVRDDEFRALISGLNSRLQTAFDPFRARAVFDAALSAVTGFVWDDLGFTGAKAGEKSVEKFLNAWNARKERDGVDVRVVQLRTTGFMSLDFVVPDPGIDGLLDAEPQHSPMQTQNLGSATGSHTGVGVAA